MWIRTQSHSNDRTSTMGEVQLSSLKTFWSYYPVYLATCCMEELRHCQAHCREMPGARSTMESSLAMQSFRLSFSNPPEGGCWLLKSLGQVWKFLPRCPLLLFERVLKLALPPTAQIPAEVYAEDITIYNYLTIHLSCCE